MKIFKKFWYSYANPAYGQEISPAYGSSYDAYDNSDYSDSAYGLSVSDEVLECLSGPQGGHDANAWIKTPGEADGRMFDAGDYNPCLLGHAVECSETCPQYVMRMGDGYSRSSSCQCGD